MGNHAVGKAMAAGATALLAIKSDMAKEEAIVALDKLAEPWRDADAEFDAFDGAEDLMRLISMAFGVEPPLDDDDEYWYDEAYEPFCKRYGFW